MRGQIFAGIPFIPSHQNVDRSERMQRSEHQGEVKRSLTTLVAFAEHTLATLPVARIPWPN
jgi:hypothetical protein